MADYNATQTYFAQEIIIREELESLKERIIANHTDAGQVASGRTRDSLRVEADKSGGALIGRSPFGTLETGRKGGKVPYNFVDIIAQWIVDKGISYRAMPYVRQASARWQPKYSDPDTRGRMTLAGAIAHKIKTEGTLLYREGGRADIYSNEIPTTLRNLKDRLSVMLWNGIQTIHLNDKQTLEG
jgi:hypothetical protein